jgi:glycosyltransferase involved in cell wall biosynthesis
VTKIAFVVQRYGPEVIGGAESYCRQLAEKLVSDLKWDVTVYSSAANDYRTWKNFYSSAPDKINGVRVLRFHTVWQRSRVLFGLVSALMRFFWIINENHLLPKFILNPLEKIWFHLQGPWSPWLLRAIEQDYRNYDKIFFVTYLYYPAIYGLKLAGTKAVLIPTAHNEPPFYSNHVKRLLTDAPQILALTETEASLIKSNLPMNQHQKVSYLGYGLDLPTEVGHEKGSTSREPYLLYLGRIGKGKGIDQLIKYFTWCVSTNGLNLKLYLAGAIEDGFEINSHPNIIALGRVSEDEKLKLIAESMAVLNPSSHESLSMIVVEAMLMGRPAVVNSESPVLKFYTENTKTVLGYSDIESFHATLNKLLDQTNSKMLSADLADTRTWARERFAWQNIFRKLETIVKS